MAIANIRSEIVAANALMHINIMPPIGPHFFKARGTEMTPVPTVTVHMLATLPKYLMALEIDLLLRRVVVVVIVACTCSVAGIRPAGGSFDEMLEFEVRDRSFSWNFPSQDLQASTAVLSSHVQCFCCAAAKT